MRSRSEKVARPAGLEPATFGSGGPRKETTGGSVEPLPLFSLGNFTTRGNTRKLRAATHCQSFVSRLASQPISRQTRRPIARASPAMCHGNDHDPGGFNSIDNAEGKAPKQVAPRSVIEWRPRVGQSRDRGFGFVHLVAERGCRRRAAFCVPARRRYGFFDGVLKILKPAGHGRRLRGSDAVPRTMGLSSRYRNQADPAALESLRTRPLPRPGRSRGRGCESARLPTPLALHRIAGAPQPTVAWHP